MGSLRASSSTSPFRLSGGPGVRRAPTPSGKNPLRFLPLRRAGRRLPTANPFRLLPLSRWSCRRPSELGVAPFTGYRAAVSARASGSGTSWSSGGLPTPPPTHMYAANVGLLDRFRCWPCQRRNLPRPRHVLHLLRLSRLLRRWPVLRRRFHPQHRPRQRALLSRRRLTLRFGRECACAGRRIGMRTARMSTGTHRSGKPRAGGGYRHTGALDQGGRTKEVFARVA